MSHDPKDDEPTPSSSEPPTSRVARMLKLGTLAPRAALAGARRALASRPTTDEERLAERQRTSAEAKKVAEAMLKTLGEMKGLPLKIGQMVSYIDGLAPPGYEERFQAALAKLQQKAPPLDPAVAERVIRAELKGAPTDLFASFEREPFAAASIGQVHRAVTHAGEHVAVKVQYPGIDKAIENDLKSIALLEQFAAPFARQYHTKEGLDEIRAVFLSELDYAREARMTDLFRSITHDLPGVIIPRVHHSLSTRRVLTTELLGGRTYQDFCATAPQETRSLAGVRLWSFMFRSLLRYGMLYADPHPGNYRFFDDGRVGVLDFGCIKPLPPSLVAGMKRYMSAAMDGDDAAFDQACIDVLGYDPADPEGWDLYRGYARELLEPIVTRDSFRWSPAVARESVAYLARGIKKIAFKEGESVPIMPKPIHMPQDFTFVNRLQWGLGSILGGLGTEARFRPLIEPWVRDGQWPLPAGLAARPAWSLPAGLVARPAWSLPAGLVARPGWSG
jgi:predicted unusual protein kinase regulating ubiquinone biosynthesis (AarF/ABC1/UbiB family)